MRSVLYTLIFGVWLCCGWYIYATADWPALDEKYWYEYPITTTLSAPKWSINVKYNGLTKNGKISISVYNKKQKKKDCLVEWELYSAPWDPEERYSFDKYSFQWFSFFSPRGWYVFFYVKWGFENEDKIHYVMDTTSCKVIDRDFYLPYFDWIYLWYSESSKESFERLKTKNEAESIKKSFFWTKNGKQLIGLTQDEDWWYGSHPPAIFITSSGSIAKSTNLPLWKLLGYRDPMELESTENILETISIETFSFNESKKNVFLTYLFVREKTIIDAEWNDKRIIDKQTEWSITIDIKKYLQ